MRIILDTNICLDLFVFHDPRWSKLIDAMKNGDVNALTRDDCRMEWLIVLDYPHLPLNEASKIQAKLDFDTLITCLSLPLATSLAVAPLPFCSDHDDQKFLELSRDAHADVLITKDKALLKLARKTAKAGLFRILSPDSWTLEWSLQHP